MNDLSTYLHSLPEKAAGLTPPPRFTFPFYYRPDPLAVVAVSGLQDHLRNQTAWEHDFGLAENDTGGQGKMFGVLVVRSKSGVLFYLSAYSGKLAESNHLPGFVPPVFDLLDEAGFYRRGEQEVNRITLKIQKKKISDEYLSALSILQSEQHAGAEILSEERVKVKAGKKRRKELRAAATHLSVAEQKELAQRLSAESIRESYGLKDLTKAVKNRIRLAQESLEAHELAITTLEQERSRMSNVLQQRIFDHYTFLNHRGERRGLGDIFRQTVFGVPPAGAGECAAPKLLEFAYRHGLTPVALAEFWWGQSPASEIRKHGHFYPACRGKCLPILGHMLEGLDVDPDPMLENPAAGKVLTTVYEDDQLMVINKPAGFLSVPGKNIEDSVWRRIKERYPEATGPLIVHRLDMSTSGLMLVTKTKEAHKLLQRQFFKRSVQKCYVALVAGVVNGERGTIDLPLRGDLDDRPRQIVCTEHGKTSRSHWEVVERRGNTTLIHFWPVTGRTHQLRVHAAHPDGLNCPIVGDDLYGQADERLCLHAESLSFVHPVTKQEMTLTVSERFEL